MHIGPRYTGFKTLDGMNISVGIGDGVDNSIQLEIQNPNYKFYDEERNLLIEGARIMSNLDANMVNDLIETLQRFRKEHNIGKGFYYNLI